jgi:hypothetical protein
VLRSIVAAVGGWRAIDRCGRVATGPYENPIVAWELHQHLPDLTIRGVSRGTAVVMPSDPIRGRHGRDGLPPQLRVSRRVVMRPWVVASSCQLGAAARGAP